jgi:excinuclease ABC subunit B
VNGSVILYADKETDSIRATLSETNRRREIQEAYNVEHGITPTTITKKIGSIQDSIWEADYVTVDVGKKRPEDDIPAHELPGLIESLRKGMREAAKELDFERAAELRDRIQALEDERLRIG